MPRKDIEKPEDSAVKKLLVAIILLQFCVAGNGFSNNAQQSKAKEKNKANPKSVPSQKPINPFAKSTKKKAAESKRPANPFAKSKKGEKTTKPNPFAQPRGGKKSPFGNVETAPGSRNGTSPFGPKKMTTRKGSSKNVVNPFKKPEKDLDPNNPFAARVAGSGSAGKRVKYHWKVGVVVEARNGLAGRLWGTTAIPSEWPEQTVKVVKREVSSHIRNFKIRKTKDGVEQMFFEIPRLVPGQKATALLTYEIEKQPVLLPENVESFTLPTRVPRDVAKHLGTSPMIESRHHTIRKKAKDLTAAKSSEWERVKAIYDFVRDEIELTSGQLKGAVKTLEQGNGQKEDLICLFIALCRSARVPARTVWVPNHVYAEFYLVDPAEEEKGYWLPCELVGERHFGATNDVRPILQRGDSFDVPEKRGPQRFVAELLKGKAGAGLTPPSHRFVRELTTVSLVK